MCLILAKPAGANAPGYTTFESALDCNSDALGIAYPKDGTMRIHKWVKPTRKQLEKAYEVFVEQDTSVIAHFRLTTHGSNDHSNCHPFPLGGDAVVAHNGIIPGFGKGKKSDTADFVERVIRPGYTVHGIEFLKELDKLAKSIGYSKLCAMNIDGEFFFANEEMGGWVNGCWYSASPYQYAYGTKTSYSYGGSYKSGNSIYDCEYDTACWYDDDDAGDPTDVFDVGMSVAQRLDLLSDCYTYNVCAVCGDNTTNDNYCQACSAYTTRVGVLFGPPGMGIASNTGGDSEYWKAWRLAKMRDLVIARAPVQHGIVRSEGQ